MEGYVKKQNESLNNGKIYTQWNYKLTNRMIDWEMDDNMNIYLVESYTICINITYVIKDHRCQHWSLTPGHQYW